MYLRQMLYRCDTRLLPVIASYWLNLQRTPNYEELIRMLCEKMLNTNVLSKMLDKDQTGGMAAGLQYLIGNGGIVTAENFESHFGEFRIAGTEKILREKLWRNPVSAAEELFYRGLIFKENRFSADELKDCFILPQDIAALLRSILPDTDAPQPEARPLAVRPAVPAETAFVIPSEDNIPDLFCFAAALRREGKAFELPEYDLSEARKNFIDMLLHEGAFFNKDGTANQDRIRRFLIGNRTAAKLLLTQLWRSSSSYDELTQNTTELTVKTKPEFERQQPRKIILDHLSNLPPEIWWSVNGFISAVKKQTPDFLRRAFGDSHGQIIDRDGNDLSGIGSWYQLEGAYIRFLLFGPLTWLGIIQSSSASEADLTPTAFRISKEALFFLAESAGSEISKEILSKPNLEQAHPVIAADGTISCGRNVPRYFRYMAARFCVIEKFKADVCVFRMTPGSLAEAEKNGIGPDAILSLLKRFSGKALPPTLERMLASSGRNTLPATIYKATILTLPSAEVMDRLLETARLEKWIFQQINPNSLLIDPRGVEEIRRFLMENEIFVDVQL